MVRPCANSIFFAAASPAKPQCGHQCLLYATSMLSVYEVRMIACHSYYSQPLLRALVMALLVPGLGLGGCANLGDSFASGAFVDPAKYDMYECKQLEPERKTLANRAAELQGLMAKADTGAGGAVWGRWSIATTTSRRAPRPNWPTKPGAATNATTRQPRLPRRRLLRRLPIQRQAFTSVAPVVNPVLSRQQAFCTHRPNREIAGKGHRAGQMIDPSRAPRGALPSAPPASGAAARSVASLLAMVGPPSLVGSRRDIWPHTAASSIAIPAPCAANGSIACAASPSRAPRAGGPFAAFGDREQRPLPPNCPRRRPSFARRRAMATTRRHS